MKAVIVSSFAVLRFDRSKVALRCTDEGDKMLECSCEMDEIPYFRADMDPRMVAR